MPQPIRIKENWEAAGKGRSRRTGKGGKERQLEGEVQKKSEL